MRNKHKMTPAYILDNLLGNLFYSSVPFILLCFLKIEQQTKVKWRKVDEFDINEKHLSMIILIRFKAESVASPRFLISTGTLRPLSREPSEIDSNGHQ